VVDASGVMVARLATSEFLIEAVDGGAERVAASLPQLGSAARPTNVYPVARQDLVVGIQGSGTQTLLRQICSVDFVPLFESCGPTAGPVVLTSMIGVGVVAWPRRTESGSTLRVWLDPSFAHYFWTTLLEVGRGVGAMVIGSST
jgi:sarcosine oxidase subunit gamma